MSDLDSVTRIEIGMPVHDWSGSRIGTLDDINQQIARIGSYEVPISAIDRIRPEGIFLKEGVVFPDRGVTGGAGQGGLAGGLPAAGGMPAAGEASALRVPLVEEHLQVERRPTQGVVEVRKRVEEVEEVVREALAHDVVEVERVPVNRQLDGPIGQRMDGEWLVVPVLEEVLVVEKRLMLKEEVRIRTRKETRQAELRDHVRRERVEVTPEGDTPRHHVVEVSRSGAVAAGAAGAADIADAREGDVGAGEVDRMNPRLGEDARA